MSRQDLLKNEENREYDSASDLDAEIETLTSVEKQFLLQAERGDCATVKRLIEEYRNQPEQLNINCVDPLNRSALVSAIENENIELVRLLLDEKVQVKDCLLLAIKEEYVEAVEVLLSWEENNHVPNTPYSWESVDNSVSSFTPDITPLILAAHKNNYEIIKLLLDRGATLPIPHDVKCGCEECVESNEKDSLRHSQSRINAYKALCSPSLIALSSPDPILTAFELSRELKRLSQMENEFRLDYNELRNQTQTFATCLLDYVRTSGELEIILNFNSFGENWDPGDRQTLERLKLAIKYKQKSFIAHANVQQLLGTLWYDGLPGFRRKTMFGQMLQVVKFSAMFPVYCMIYMLAPESNLGKFMKKPFVKFICHSSSYAVFLALLGIASQRIEIMALELIGLPWMIQMVEDWKRHERGALPGFAECGVIVYMISLVWVEIKTLYSDGVLEYIQDLWNIVDCLTHSSLFCWLILRMYSYFQVQMEASRGINPWIPREQWQPFDPMLISEGAFAAGMIFSFLKLIHIFSVNPHLGPLQISLGRMIIDIIKFFFIYNLVLFAFACGLNQLLWYYANIEKQKCFRSIHGDVPDYENNEKACSIWRRYSNLFETSQSLFWASFGLVDLMNFELTGIKEFTRFWALLMFGCYSVINIIVLLNMLIAMMSNSYQLISERSDTEWKFARSNLWMSYFDDGDVLPPPFNIIPTPHMLFGGCKKNQRTTQSFMNKNSKRAIQRHSTVMKLLVKRYVTAEQRNRDESGITEDDVMEIRQDISSLRYELIDILHSNGMKTPTITLQDTIVAKKKEREMERRLISDFQITTVQASLLSGDDVIKPKDVFSHIAKVVNTRSHKKQKEKQWDSARQKSMKADPIGTLSSMKMSRRSESTETMPSSPSMISVDHNKLIEYNPNLANVSKGTRVAFRKFMNVKFAPDQFAIEEVNERSRSTSRASGSEEKLHAQTDGESKSESSVVDKDETVEASKEVVVMHEIKNETKRSSHTNWI